MVKKPIKLTINQLILVSYRNFSLALLAG